MFDGKYPWDHLLLTIEDRWSLYDISPIPPLYNGSHPTQSVQAFSGGRLGIATPTSATPTDMHAYGHPSETPPSDLITRTSELRWQIIGKSDLDSRPNGTRTPSPDYDSGFALDRVSDPIVAVTLFRILVISYCI